MHQEPIGPSGEGLRGKLASGRALSRRAVLRAGAVGVAATAAVTAVPGLMADLVSDGPEAADDTAGATADVDSAAASESGGTIVAHIRDASTGEISIYSGEQEVTYRDPALVQRLMRAAPR